MTKKKSNKTHRRPLRLLKATPFQLVRGFNHQEDKLPDLTYDNDGVNVPGNKRCHAIGLEMGDCRQQRASGSLYCYYHDKLQVELTTPSVATPEDPRDGMALYPTWPLPVAGYFLLEESPRRLAVA